MRRLISHLLSITAIAILLFLMCGNFVLAVEAGFKISNLDNREILKSISLQIEEIQKKIDSLWEQYMKMVEKMPLIKEIQNKFKNDMSFGSRGNDVETLQEFLSVFSSSGNVFYPEGLITGYFGKLTEAAVKRFQKQHNLEETGTVNLTTRKILNNLYFSKTERDWFEKQ